MKVGEVYSVISAHRVLIYIVIEDYEVLRPLVLRSTSPDDDELYSLTVNMAVDNCKRVTSNFYDNAVKIADSLEEYIASNVVDGILLGTI